MHHLQSREPLRPFPTPIKHHLHSLRVSAAPPHPYPALLTVMSLPVSISPLSCTTQSDESSNLTQPSIMHHLMSSRVSANGIHPTLFHAPLKVFPSLCVPSLYSLSCTSHSLPESPELTVILGAWGIRSSHGD